MNRTERLFKCTFLLLISRPIPLFAPNKPKTAWHPGAVHCVLVQFVLRPESIMLTIHITLQIQPHHDHC